MANENNIKNTDKDALRLMQEKVDGFRGPGIVKFFVAADSKNLAVSFGGAPYDLTYAMYKAVEGEPRVARMFGTALGATAAMDPDSDAAVILQAALKKMLDDHPEYKDKVAANIGL